MAHSLGLKQASAVPVIVGLGAAASTSGITVPKNESTESTIMLRAFLSTTRVTTQNPKPWPPFSLQRARCREQNVTSQRERELLLVH